MNNTLPPELKEKMTVFCKEILAEMTENHAQNYKELLATWQELHTIYLTTTAEILEQWATTNDLQNLEETNLLDKIEADSVVVEITDHNTGNVFRRNLPIDYVETDNGIRLSGETIDGTMTQIVFYSETAMTKINELLGKGPDAPRCNHDK